MELILRGVGGEEHASLTKHDERDKKNRLGERSGLGEGLKVTKENNSLS